MTGRAIPRPERRSEFIPALPAHALSWLTGQLGPAERRCLREIAEGADLLEVDGQAFILAPVSPDALEALASFEAEGEDREPDLEDEPDSDHEPEPACRPIEGVSKPLPEPRCLTVAGLLHASTQNSATTAAPARTPSQKPASNGFSSFFGHSADTKKRRRVRGPICLVCC